ncbi:AsmA family protein [Bacteroidota bacterium]
MKKIIKIITYFFIILILLIVALAVTAKLTENKITDIALKKVSESIKAPVKIGQVSFNLLRKFPLATIELNNVLLNESNLLGDTSNTNNPDTIISIKKIYVSVKSKPLMKGNFEIMKVNIDGAYINYKVDTSGTTNIDFLINSTDTVVTDTLPSKPLNLTLTDISVKNISCNYIDKKLNAASKLVIPELKIKAKIDSINIITSAKGVIKLSNSSFSETNLHLMNETEINFDVDYENDSINIKELIVNTDGAELKIKGNVILGDAIKTDIEFQGTNLIIDELIKYAPKEILKEYGLNNVSGKLDLYATVKGSYADNEMPHVDLKINFSDGNIVTTDYPELKNVSFDGRVTNGILRNNQSTQADFSSFHFETDKSKFDVAFSVLDIDHPKYNVKTDMEVNVGEFSDFIPDSLIEYIDGDIKASVSTRGELPDSIGDDFVDYILVKSSANLELRNFNIDMDSSLSIKDFSGKFIYKPCDFKVEDLNVSVPAYKIYIKNTSLETKFSGSINKISEMSLELKSYQIEINRSEIKGSASINNLENPTYKINTNIKLFLDELKPALPDTLLTKLRGKISGNIQSSGTVNLDSIAGQVMDILFTSSSFNIDFDKIFVEMPDDTLYKVEDFSGKFQMSPMLISINKMKGKLAGIEFRIDSTKIENLYNSVIKNQAEQLTINTRLSLGNLDYSMFAPFMVSDSTQSTDNESREPESDPLNYTMLVKGVAKVKSFKYDSVFIHDISTLFNITDSVYIIDQFKFKAFDGLMNTSVKYMIKPDNKSVIETHHIIDKMDINKLLTDFNDFEEFYEPSIRSENLSGLFSTDLYSRFNMIGDSLVQKDMRVRGEITLDDGGVYDFEPATNLSKFTGIDELDNIKFKTLNSTIFVFKDAIYVPETFISSTALNITAYGMQSLGEDYEYHLEIKLSDILFGKSKKQKRKERKAGEDDFKDDRNMRELIYSELDGKTKYGFDNDDLQRAMRNKIKLQETKLKLRFYPGMFNFDTKVYLDKNNR